MKVFNKGLLETFVYNDVFKADVYFLCQGGDLTAGVYLAVNKTIFNYIFRKCYPVPLLAIAFLVVFCHFHE